MDASRVIGAAFLTLCFVLLSNQLAADGNDPSTGFLCPLMDFPKTVNKTIVHNITRTAKCVNGRQMAGCCIPGFYCDFNTSNIDLTLYGPPGYRNPCSDSLCCPQDAILPMPLPKLNDTGSTSADGNDKDGDYSIDSDDD